VIVSRSHCPACRDASSFLKPLDMRMLNYILVIYVGYGESASDSSCGEKQLKVSEGC
jgi:hypothetical protein